MGILDLAKSGVSLIASVGVGAIVGNLITATTPSDVKRITKICIGLGSLVLSGIASDLASKYTEEQIDSVVETVKGITKTEEIEEGVTEDIEA